MVKTRVSIGTVWDRTTEFLADRLARILPIALLTIFVPSSLASALEGVPGVAAVPAAMLAVTLALLFVTLLGQLALTALVLDPTPGRAPVRRAGARFLPALGLFGAVAIVLSLLLLPIPVMLYANGVDMSAGGEVSAQTLPPAVALPIAVYALVLIFVIVWIAARLLVMLPVALAERRGFGALARSIALTRGLTLQLIGVIILYATIVLIATVAAQSVFGAIFALTTSSASGELRVAQVLTAIVVSAVMTVFTVIQAVFVAQLYRATAADEGVGGDAQDRFAKSPWTGPVDPV